MKLISLNCPKCGSAIEVDSTSKRAKCEYCGNSIILDDNTVTIKHMVEGSITEEQEFINAKTNLEVLKDYDAAYLGYLDLSTRYVNNYEIWLGLLLSFTEDFTAIQDKQKTKEYWNKFIALAPSNEISKYEVSYKRYMIVLNENEIKEEKKDDTRKVKTVIFNIIKSICAVFFIIVAFIELEYSILAFISLLLLALVLLDGVLIKTVLIPIKSVKYPLIIFLFFFGILSSSSSIPSAYYGTYTSVDGAIEKIVIKENSEHIYIDGEKQEVDISNYYEGIIYLEVEDMKYKLEVNEKDNSLCLLDKNDKCSYTLTKEKNSE